MLTLTVYLSVDARHVVLADILLVRLVLTSSS